jgi:formylmethanofuran dehydrogenase subunit E
MNADQLLNQVEQFHGHMCPGLMLGYRMATAALRFLNVTRDQDEELFAIVENDACGVDALQVITGCTMGKGNLMYRDYGKLAFTIIRRSDGKAVRVSPSPEQDKRRQNNRKDEKAREEFLQWLRSAPEEEVLQMRKIDITTPPPARILASVTCTRCGELVMESRARLQDGKIVCIPCFETL